MKLKKWAFVICSLLPTKKTILFESVPDIEGNSKVVFEEMKKRNMNKAYKMVWLVEDKRLYENDSTRNIYFESKPNNLLSKALYVLKFFNVAAKISENGCYPKFHKKTVALHLGHGTAIKNTGNIMFLNDAADYVLYQSEYVKNQTAMLHDVKLDQLVCLGIPRNDDLLKANRREVSEQYIVWLPTFRKSNSNRVDSQYHFPFGIPVFQRYEELERLNKTLQKANLKLYIKPHPAENLTAWEHIKLSHLQLIDRQFYQANNLSLYEFLGMSEALITDYSSVYFDYLLVDKPIGITVDDYEYYKQERGFVFEDFQAEIKGEYIECFHELEQFIECCINKKIDINDLSAAKKRFNQYETPDSAGRVVDFLQTKLKAFKVET